MSERILRFGNLEDIIFVKEVEIQFLQDEIVALFEELDDPEDCALFTERSGCRGCYLEKQCEKVAELYHAKRKELQEKQDKITNEILALHNEKYLHELKLIEKWTESLKKIPNE